MARSQSSDDDGTYSPPSPSRMENAEESGRVDPEDPPAETPVRLLASVGQTAKPQVLAAETSTTGKTLSITRTDGPTHRLSADELFAGETIERDGYWYELYTPDRYRRQLGPAGRDPSGDVPAATHRPAPPAETTTDEHDCEPETGREAIDD